MYCLVMAEASSSRGPPIYGNYHGSVFTNISIDLIVITDIILRLRYYTKRPINRDPRLALVPKDIFQNARVLDIGCNEGVVTCEVGKRVHISRRSELDASSSIIISSKTRRQRSHRRRHRRQPRPFSMEAATHSLVPVPSPHNDFKPHRCRC